MHNYFEKIKQSSQAVLDGIEITLTKSNSSFEIAEFRDKSGHCVRIQVEYSTLRISVPAKPETKKMFRVEGTAAGLAVNEDFEHRFEAESRKDKLVRLTSSESDCDLKVSEVEVEIPF